MLPNDAVLEVNKLKHHVMKGCLAGTPSGCGTTNEAFHKHLNRMLHLSKVGVFLAYALLTVAISHNNRYTNILVDISANLL